MENRNYADAGEQIAALKIELENLTVCRNHWKISYKTVRNELASLMTVNADLLAACKKAMAECSDLIATEAGNTIEAAIAHAEEVAIPDPIDDPAYQQKARQWENSID